LANLPISSIIFLILKIVLDNGNKLWYNNSRDWKEVHIGKARYPHNSKRPEPAGVRKAIASADKEALRIALTPRQRAFCHEYVVDFNASAAAVRAGYAPLYVDRQAWVLKNHAGVQAYIDHLTKSKEAKVMSVNPEYLIQKVTAIINDDSAKDNDKLRGIEMLMRHLGMFVERTEITGKDGGAIEVEQRRIEQEAQSFTSLIQGLKERADGTTLN
jgi:phage terminase small subunit